VPTAVFSEPEVGTVGLTEAQACERLAKVDIYKTSFRPLKMTLAGRDTRAFFKLVVDGESDQLVGCHIVGPDAGEMIQLVAVALKMKATKADIDAVIAVHPTAAEELVTLRERALSHRREAAE
jgi:glutathione reductase (NADPH)